MKIAITFTLRFYMLFSVFWRKISNTKASLLGLFRGGNGITFTIICRFAKSSFGESNYHNGKKIKAIPG
ncbi:MAG: hypothetical protein J6W02_06035, partial [Bacteroidaceae bacterium]|nr:hypothetical protein [Bacteroidaceae bacterium]